MATPQTVMQMTARRKREHCTQLLVLRKKQNLVLILFLTGPQRRGVEIAVPQVCRDLFKGTSFASIKATGHVVKPNTDKNHGYAIEKQSDWAYVLKDKTESKLTHQNFAPWFQGLSFHSVTV